MQITRSDELEQVSSLVRTTLDGDLEEADGALKADLTVVARGSGGHADTQQARCSGS